jgi:myo-inositol 2-dehydrogenase/D-chiro-inositol 1-dehydrogenase/scyllo-inositol 2-dehydrogenase (NAD+)
MSDVVRFVLAGAGRAGIVHGRNLAAGVPGASLAAIADPDSTMRNAAAHELGCDLTFDNSLEGVTDDRIDAVVISGPTSTHADLAIAALDAGKHVLCEVQILGYPHDGVHAAFRL